MWKRWAGEKVSDGKQYYFTASRRVKTFIYTCLWRGGEGVYNNKNRCVWTAANGSTNHFSHGDLSANQQNNNGTSGDDCNGLLPRLSNPFRTLPHIYTRTLSLLLHVFNTNTNLNTNIHVLTHTYAHTHPLCAVLSLRPARCYHRHSWNKRDADNVSSMVHDNDGDDARAESRGVSQVCSQILTQGAVADI